MMIYITEKISLFPIVSPEIGWKLDLFEAAEPIGAHFHENQKQIILVAEGKMKASVGNRDSILQTGELIVIDPGVVHTLIPEGKTHFFALDIPSGPQGELLPFSIGEKFDRGTYIVYELIQKEGWSAALIELEDSPKHYHKIEKEIFIVVHGQLNIEIDGTHQTLEVGESISLPPGRVHQLKSGNKGRVRVLCFSFPAFSPSDMHLILDGVNEFFAGP